MSTSFNVLDTKGRSNRPNESGKQQITLAEKIILLPADEYFKDHEHDPMDYKDLHIGIVFINDIYLPIQSTKHYWLFNNIDKAKRSIRKINLDAPINVMTFNEYSELTSPVNKNLEFPFLMIKRSADPNDCVPIEIKRVLYLLREGERINIILEISDQGCSIAFHEHRLVGFSHITDETLNIQYYETVDMAIKELTLLRTYMNCQICLRFLNIAKISPINKLALI